MLIAMTNSDQKTSGHSYTMFTELIGNFLKASTEKFLEGVKNVKKIGEDDPRRIVHSIKVGLALTLVSLFYYLRPMYDGFGQAGMWAILTVVVVFEFTVGGTLSKSINRVIATFVAAALGVGAEYLASLCGERGEPVVLGALVFVLAAAATFTRFFPSIKKKYDYGVLIFILTFSLVAISGTRVTEILQLGHQRLSTILIGGSTCITISIFVCPVWAGKDLHDLVAGNIEKLASFLEGFGGEFGSSPGDDVVSPKDDKDKSYLQAYKSVLNSKANEESLANFAWWEPGHGRFRFNHPWKQYLKIGDVARECAALMETLSRSANNTKLLSDVNLQASNYKFKHEDSEFKLKIQPTCKKLSTESSKALKELGSAIKHMRFPSPATATHLNNSKSAADELKTLLENSSLTSRSLDLQQIMPLLLISSLLIDIIKCLEDMSVSIHALSQMARFRQTSYSADKKPQLRCGIVKPVDEHVVVIEIVKPVDEHVVVNVIEISKILEESKINLDDHHHQLSEKEQDHHQVNKL